VKHTVSLKEDKLQRSVT